MSEDSGCHYHKQQGCDIYRVVEVVNRTQHPLECDRENETRLRLDLYN